MGRPPNPVAKPSAPLELPEEDRKAITSAIRAILTDTNTSTKERLDAINAMIRWQQVLHKIEGAEDDGSSFFSGSR